MKLITCGLLLVCFTSVAAAQESLREDQYKALKNLPEVTLLVHEPNDSEAVTNLISGLGLDSKTISGVVRIALTKAAPALHLTETFRNDKPYLVLGWYGNMSGLSLSLDVWRWVLIEGTTERRFIPVWHEEGLTVNPNRQSIRDRLDDFTTALASDYLRANR